MSNPKSIGTVKWWNDPKGYGFLVNESGEDVFVHHTAINPDADEYQSLKDGQQVEYLQVKSEKGWQAAEVAVIEAMVAVNRLV